MIRNLIFIFVNWNRYIANVIYTLVGDDFQEWIKVRVNAKREKRARESNLNIQMDPEIARIFQESTADSRMKGNSHNLLKPDAKRRSKFFFPLFFIVA